MIPTLALMMGANWMTRTRIGNVSQRAYRSLNRKLDDTMHGGEL
jgi:hypothetical protein